MTATREGPDGQPTERPAERPPSRPTQRPWLDADLPVAQRVELLMGAMTLEEKVGQTHQVANIHPDDDADALRIGPVQAAFPPGFLRRTEREEDVAIHPTRLFRRRHRGRVEALHLSRDPDRELARVEGLDEADPALAGDGGLPGRGRVEPDRRDRAQPGHRDTSHRAILDS